MKLRQKRPQKPATAFRLVRDTSGRVAESAALTGELWGILMDAAGGNPIGDRIYAVRGQPVMLDSDLAIVYGVSVAELNRAVGRRPKRFPDSNAFWLTQEELDSLPVQTGRHRHEACRAFTSDGAIALAFVLQSAEAVAACIRVVNAVVEAHDHPLSAMFGTDGADAVSVTERDSLSDSAFQLLPALVALDPHQRPTLKDVAEKAAVKRRKKK